MVSFAVQKFATLTRSHLLFVFICIALGLPRWYSGKKICLPMQETQETLVQSLGPEDPLEKELATHCSILA